MAGCHKPHTVTMVGLCQALCIKRESTIGADVGELYETMKMRIKMREKGLTSPAKSVKAATRTLIEKLAEIDPSEEIMITSGGSVLAK